VFVGDTQLGKSEGDRENWGKTLNQITTDPVFQGVEFLMSAGDQINSDEGNTGDQAMYDSYFDHEELMSIAQVAVLGNHDNKT